MNKQIIEAKKIYTIKLQELNKKSNLLSNIRLISFLLILALVCLLLENKMSFLLFFIYIMSALFIIVVIYHYFIDNKKKVFTSYLKIIEEYENRNNNKWKESDSHITTDIDYINDLNLIGNASLFEYINLTKTLGGKKRLFSKLNLSNIKASEIKEKQESIAELTNNFSFILKTESLLSEIKSSKEIDFKEYFYLFDTKMNYNYLPFIISIIFSIISIIILILSFIISPLFFPFFILLALMQTSYAYLYSTHRSTIYQNIATCSKQYRKLKELYCYLSQVELQSSYNQEIISKIKKGKITLQKIISIAGLDTLRNNFITYIFCNTIMSLNFFIIYKYNNLLKSSTHLFKESITALEELECLISFTTIGYTKKNICFPSITDKVSINFTDIRHPLLDEKNCVPNSFKTNEEINIITGSNMSGKTSFMKTIGVNLVLAYNGAYVNANSFTCSIMNIFTSINVKDDISRGISTFYGELLRIKNILDYSNKNNNPLVIFIDEIFKGTNYNDRIIGAKETLKKLSKINCIVFLTTHDFELCEIKDKKINNYHFSEDYIKNKISFDYKIKSGKCKTTNAKYLMKQMNIIDK